jgi:hypothetical protein
VLGNRATLQKIAYQQNNILLFHIPTERRDHKALIKSFYPSYLENADWYQRINPPPQSHIEALTRTLGSKVPV